VGTTLKSRLGKFFFSYLPITRENFEIIRHEFRMFRVNLNNFLNPIAIFNLRKGIAGKDLSINLGAGPFGKSGWVNVDIRKFKHINFTYDFRKKLPFKTNSVRRIRLEHVFEHLDIKDEVPVFLKECLRVLQPNGVLRIVVPDLGKFISAYISNDLNQWALLGWNLNHLPPNFYTPMDILNHTFRQDGEHKYGYDQSTLVKTIERAGFNQVIVQEWGSSVDPLLADDLENHRYYSLYVEAIK